MKKILIVDRTVPDVGGVRTYVKNLTLLLKNEGFVVDNYTTVHNGSFIDKYILRTVRFIANKVYNPIGIIIDNYLFGKLFNLIIPSGYDIYIIQQPIYLNTKNISKCLMITHAVFTDNIQGANSNASAVNKCFIYEKRLLEKYNNINFTVSEAYSNYINTTYKLNNKINYIDNFLIEKFYEKDWNKRSIDIIFTGQFNARKNIFYLLKLLELYLNNFKDKNLNTLILGNGPLKKDIENYIAEKTILKKNIKIILSPGREIIKEKLSDSKVLILPSVKESFSYSLLEAKLSGCLTMASKDLEVPKGFIDYPIDLNDYKKPLKILEEILSNDFNRSSVHENFENPLNVASNKFQKILNKY